MIKLVITGKTYPFKETLKKTGFHWDGVNKVWYNIYEESQKKKAEVIAAGFEENGLQATFSIAQAPPTVKKYPVKESWIFNLESMHDKLWVIEHDLDEGNMSFPITIAGTEIKDFDDLYNLREEASELEWKAKSGAVTGSQYGRIKEIVGWRVNQRYATCLAAGMNERDAGRCFEDM